MTSHRTKELFSWWRMTEDAREENFIRISTFPPPLFLPIHSEHAHPLSTIPFLIRIVLCVAWFHPSDLICEERFRLIPPVRSPTFNDSASPPSFPFGAALNQLLFIFLASAIRWFWVNKLLWDQTFALFAKFLHYQRIFKKNIFHQKSSLRTNLSHAPWKISLQI